MKIKRNSWLALAGGALLLAACSGGYSSPTAAPMSKIVVVQITDNAFVPKDVQISPGDTVRWVVTGNNSNHTVTASDGSFDSGKVFVSTGAAYDRTFTMAGTTINYYCQSHQKCCLMQGAVSVGSGAPLPHPGY